MSLGAIARLPSTPSGRIVAMRRPSTRLKAIVCSNSVRSAATYSGSKTIAFAMAAAEPEGAGRQLLHDPLGAAADHHHLHLAVDPLALRAAHVAHAAEDLHRLVGAELHRLRRVVLQQAELGHPVGGVGLAGV